MKLLVEATSGWFASRCSKDATSSVVRSMCDPEERYGIPRCAVEDLAGGSVDQNAEAMRRIFAGDRGPHRDAVLLNSALVLEAMGRAEGRDAVAIAASAIDGGRVTALVKAVGEASR